LKIKITFEDKSFTDYSKIEINSSVKESPFYNFKLKSSEKKLKTTDSDVIFSDK
jgi:hypothetical protein